MKVNIKVMLRSKMCVLKQICLKRNKASKERRMDGEIVMDTEENPPVTQIINHGEKGFAILLLFSIISHSLK